MERLTTRNSIGRAVYKNPFECERCGDIIWRMPDYGNGSPTEKLADYEDAEEQEILLRLPCKVGDTAWYLSRSGIHEVEIDSFVVNINIFANVSYYIGCEKFGKTLTPYKTLFFSREEAEAKLKEMEKWRV